MSSLIDINNSSLNSTHLLFPHVNLNFGNDSKPVVNTDNVFEHINLDKVVDETGNNISNFKTEPRLIPAGLAWTAEKAELAASRVHYINVNSNADMSVGPRVLSGAIKRWMKEPDVIYVNDNKYRITGTRADIEMALEYAQFPAPLISQILDTAITKDNYLNDKKAEFNKEIVSYSTRASKKSNKDTPVLSMEYLSWLKENLSKGQKVSKKGNYLMASNMTTSSRSKSLKTKYENVIGKSGKVLDISVRWGKISQESIKPRNGKIKAPTLKIITDDADKFVDAIQEIFGNEGLITYANDINYIRSRTGHGGVGLIQSSHSPLPISSSTIPSSSIPSSTPAHKPIIIIDQQPQSSANVLTGIQSVGGEDIPSMPRYTTLTK